MRDIVVIGGGVGGLVTASVAGQLGLKVTLVERSERLGGDCLHYGCVPSKTLIKSARVASLFGRAGDFGLDAAPPGIDLARINARVRDVIETIQAYDDPQRFRAYGVEVLFGEAVFTAADEVRVKGQRVRGRRFVVATGSRPAVPPVAGLADAGFLTSEQVFGLQRMPPRLAVLGGGPLGVELAQALHRLGSRVSLLEVAPEILPREDPVFAGELRGLLAGEGLDVRVGYEVERVDRVGDRKCLQLRLRHGEDRRPLEVDEILIAAGRLPNVETLGLEAAGVAYDRGGIAVDRRMRTSRRHIFACGDVCGPYPFTHVAEYQAGIVISNAIFRFPRRADYRVVPWVTYSDPELARVGLNADEARARYPDVEVLTFAFRDVDRALAEGEPEGRMELVVRRGRILGATILGVHAGELIHEIVLAMKARVPISRLSGAIHAYPTLAQVARRCVNTHYAGTLFSARTRRVVHWINRLIP